MIYFSIANSWNTCSDNDVDRFKSFMKLNIDQSDALGNFKIICRNEWVPPTMIDVYVVPEGIDIHDHNKFLHFYIDENDNIYIANEPIG